MNKVKHIPELDGLRCLLAWWVVIDHILMACGFPAESLPRGVRLLTRGDYAVDVFIILSGFVIFKLIHDTREPYFRFLIRRFFRLFPVFLVCLVIAVFERPLIWDNLQHWKELPIVQASTQHWLDDAAQFRWHLAAHLTLLHGAVPNILLNKSASALLAPAWSISLEWQFYLIAPLLFWFLQRMRIAGWALFSAAAITGTWLLQDRLALMFGMYAFLPQKILFFWIGIVSFQLWEHRHEESEATGYFLAGLCPLILFFTLSIPLTLWAAVMAAVMAPHCGGRHINQFLRLPLVQKLGHISYSTYLIHMCCIWPLQWLIFRAFPDADRSRMLIWLLPSSILATYFTSRLMHRFIEKPGMHMGRQLASR